MVGQMPNAAGGAVASLLHWSGEAALRVRSHISPGPYRSFRELSLAGSVDPDIWCPPTFVGNSGIECFNGDRGFALFIASYSPMAEPKSKAELRATALAAREKLSDKQRTAAAGALAKRGLPIDIVRGLIVSGYSPIRNEIDPEPLMRALAAKGARLGLPRVNAPGKALALPPPAP